MSWVRPEFQPQNPAYSGFALGWSSCTSFADAMTASFDRQVKKAMTGGALRNLCRNPDGSPDRTGGTNLAQNDAALNRGWHIDLSTVYRLPWNTFERIIDSGVCATLQGLYAPIADSRFDAGNGFRDNHAMTIPPDWATMDPLADGRQSVYEYRSEPYPRDLLRQFAGALDLDPRGSEYKPLGAGLVYASFSRDRLNDYAVDFDPGHFWVYRLGADGRIHSRIAKGFSAEQHLKCTVPKSYTWPGHANRTLVKILTARSGLYHEFVGVPQANVSLRVIPT